MDQNSSIFSFRLGPAWRLILLTAATAAGYWSFADLGGRSLSESIALQFGDTLIEKSRGKVLDPAAYIEQRLRECLSLAAVACGLAAGIVLASRLLSRLVNRTWLWLPVTLIAFVEVNLFLQCAAETGAFWTVLFAGSEDSKQPGFQINRLFHRDSSAPQRAVVLGSSQAGTEIEETLLNREFGPDVNTANLFYAGAQTVDFLLVRRWYTDDLPDVAICYLSELNLYTPVSGSRFLPLLRVSGWQDLQDLEPRRFEWGNTLLHGFVGSILPLYQSRRSIEYFLYGTAAVEPSVSLRRPLPVESSDSGAGRGIDPLEASAAEAAKSYGITPDTDFHKRALERFLVQAARDGTEVVLIAGQINPLVSRRLDPEIRSDFLAYLKSLPARYSNVTCLAEELPSHPQSEYEDLMHITEEAQLAYTAKLADLLEQRFGWKRAHPGTAP